MSTNVTTHRHTHTHIPSINTLERLIQTNVTHPPPRRPNPTPRQSRQHVQHTDIPTKGNPILDVVHSVITGNHGQAHTHIPPSTQHRHLLLPDNTQHFPKTPTAPTQNTPHTPYDADNHSHTLTGTPHSPNTTQTPVVSARYTGTPPRLSSL